MIDKITCLLRSFAKTVYIGACKMSLSHSHFPFKGYSMCAMSHTWPFECRLLPHLYTLAWCLMAPAWFSFMDCLSTANFCCNNSLVSHLFARGSSVIDNGCAWRTRHLTAVRATLRECVSQMRRRQT